MATEPEEKLKTLILSVRVPDKGDGLILKRAHRAVNEFKNKDSKVRWNDTLDAAQIIHDPLSAEFIDNLWRRMRGKSKYSPNRDSIVRVMRAFVAEVSSGKENP